MWPWALVGGGAALGAVGVALVLSKASAERTLETGLQTTAEFRELENRRALHGTVGQVSVTVAVVALIAGVASLIVGP